MAVYTKLEQGDIEGLLSHYDIGELTSYKSITEGVTNTNYLVMTFKNGVSTPYILTLFEKNDDEATLSYCLGLMEHLSRAGITCPNPIADKNEKIIQTVKTKPAIIVSFLDRWHLNPEFEGFHNEWTAQTLGQLCARLHVYAKDFNGYRENNLSLDGWKKIWKKIASKANTIEPNLEIMINEEMQYLEENWPSDLPKGAIHADLFPDNVALVQASTIEGHEHERDLKGVIDFYYACNDMWMYDVAICINAWGFKLHDFAFQDYFVKPFLEAYRQERLILGYPVEQKEWDALPILCRGAAMRFLLTRCDAWLNRVDGALVNIKDPMEYWQKLNFYIKNNEIFIKILHN